MEKYSGFTRFEFYFAMASIGLIVLFAIQRYTKLADETERFSFEITAKHFNASVHNYHARWIMAQRETETTSVLMIDKKNVLFSAKGWPIAVEAGNPTSVSLKSCLSLWRHFLQNPPAISYDGGDYYGSRTYHLRLENPSVCRFEFISRHPNEFYFDYSPLTGGVNFHNPSIKKK